MSLSKPQRLTILLLVACCCVAVVACVLIHFKQQAEIRQAMNRAIFYYCFINATTDATGPPLAKVVAADSGEPVADVIVCVTLIGPDGGDGGFQCFATDEAGIAHRTHRLTPGRYQPHLQPNPTSDFASTHWKRGEPYIVVAEDGTTAVPTLRLQTKAEECAG